MLLSSAIGTIGTLREAEQNNRQNEATGGISNKKKQKRIGGKQQSQSGQVSEAKGMKVTRTQKRCRGRTEGQRRRVAEGGREQGIREEVKRGKGMYKGRKDREGRREAGRGKPNKNHGHERAAQDEALRGLEIADRKWMASPLGASRRRCQRGKRRPSWSCCQA